ncbi:glutathione S-transferase family protein [Pyxidicoccus sp. MSG2]|uniref:glutathione S-transferase family protein n=1 Tax=Pyxidicoccus sp. MSG2 TaxID=2996790 RepID=UPI00226DA02F|nr:glutathione S-transferase N-terminal domain-containing protein [Pyxidicoccus sp. MSG2]MCY1023933.1 glutathione S-transferase N-terminal domain-containing protein [Pyxidicoccus sp. MSG2]
MRLWYAPTSPFARKTRIVAHELELTEQLELVEVNPWTDGRLRALNPLAKVPTLERSDGPPIYESGVICDYLDALSGERRLFPETGEARWRALLLQGLADGASTAAGRLFADEQRPADQRSEAVLLRQAGALHAALDSLERETLEADRLTIGEVSVAAFLGYLDFRWPESDWRRGRERLSAWFAEVEQRPSMVETRHVLSPPQGQIRNAMGHGGEVQEAVNSYRVTVEAAVNQARRFTLKCVWKKLVRTSRLDEAWIEKNIESLRTGYKNIDAGKCSIYVFTIRSGPTGSEIIEAVERAKKSLVQPGKKSNLCRTTPAHNDSRVLYVGRTFTPKSRIAQHLDASTGSTYALHLLQWAKDMKLELDLQVYDVPEYQDTLPMERAMNVLETGMWDRLRPILGRRGDK